MCFILASEASNKMILLCFVVVLLFAEDIIIELKSKTFGKRTFLIYHFMFYFFSPPLHLWNGYSFLQYYLIIKNKTRL